MKPEAAYSDEARIGLVREVLQIIFGLGPEVESRVINLIKGSIDAQDIKTPELRQRIGNRAMKYLTNAIDLAREEGSEFHNEDPDMDLSKAQRGDLEPGHRHNNGMPSPTKDNTVKEGTTFKSYLLNEINFDVNLDDKESTQDAIMKIKRSAQQGSKRASLQNVKDARDSMQSARAQPDSPTKQIDLKIANLSAQLAQLQQRRAQMSKQEQEPTAPGASI